MIVKSIAVGNENEAFIETGLSSGMNIISSDDNNKGKTIVIQSMMYAIGNEPAFPTSFEYKNYSYFVEFEENKKNYKICRRGDNFILLDNKALLMFDGVSELKRYWTKNIFKLPEIVKNEIVRIVDPVLFLQLFFIGQDKKDTSNISHTGFYNKKDFEEMIYSIMGFNEYKLDLEELDDIKSRLEFLKDEKKLLLKKHKILNSKKAPLQYLSSISDRMAFTDKVDKMDKIINKITEYRKERSLILNRKLKWENIIKELNSLNRSIDAGELRCLDCDSKNIAFVSSNKKGGYAFEVSTVEMRREILKSINEKIKSLDEEMQKYDYLINEQQAKLSSLMNDETITIESIIEYKEDFTSSSDAEQQILKIEEEINELNSKIKLSNFSTSENKFNRNKLMETILDEMNVFYKTIDPNGNLVFDNLFTKKNQIFSGSEATIFHIVKMYAIQKALNHNWPIVIDSFRAEDLSTNKEKVVIDNFEKLNNQVIFTTTLKEEEIGKYNGYPGINHIDYKEHMPSKMLSSDYCERFNKMLADFGFKL